jgi:2-dehydro-3-deoxyphosphogluconate aldolase / (4S)-4-hydroxy-2-oxoglutarate aldolase
MKKDEVCAVITKLGIIPAIRVDSNDDAHFAAEAVTRGGIPIVEITMTVPRAIELIAHLVKHHPKMLVGAGTLLDVEMARKCLDAGAAFLTSPAFDPEIAEFAIKENVAMIPGAMTPTEVVVAWKAGAEFVKVFPCEQIGGEKYIKAINAALPQIPLIAAGGVNQQTAGGYISAGAVAIGIGKELIPLDAIELRKSDRIEELAYRFKKIVTEARAGVEARKKRAAVHKDIGTEECKA